MKTLFITIAGLAGLLALGAIAHAQDEVSNDRKNLNFFRIIQNRNIFDPNRREPRIIGPAPIPTYYFSLHGTMSYDSNAIALFDGTGVQRNKTYKTNDTLNGYKIMLITNSLVKLAGSSNQVLDMRVGMMMRRTGTGPWGMVASSDSYSDSGSSDSADSSTSGDSSASGSGAASGSSSGGGAGDSVMARLMARRAQEEKASGASSTGSSTGTTTNENN